MVILYLSFSPFFFFYSDFYTFTPSNFRSTSVETIDIHLHALIKLKNSTLPSLPDQEKKFNFKLPSIMKSSITQNYRITLFSLYRHDRFLRICSILHLLESYFVPRSLDGYENHKRKYFSFRLRG